MNYLERLIFSRLASTPPMLPAGGPRIQPPLPPHVRLRTPNATARKAERSVGMPAAGWRSLRFRNARVSVPGGATPQAGQGGQNCPLGQIAVWVSSPGHPPQLVCQPPPIVNPADKNKPASASGSPCPPGQLATWVAKPGHPPELVCQSKIKINENVNTLGADGITKKCPSGQIWTCRPGPGVTSGTLHCRCEDIPLSSGEIKDLFPDTVPTVPGSRAVRFVPVGTPPTTARYVLPASLNWRLARFRGRGI